MKSPNEVLVQEMTAEQQEAVAACPEHAVRYAIEQAHKKRKLINFGYFMGIVKSHLLDESGKKEKQRPTQHTASKQEEYDTSHIRKEREYEDPFETVERICQNLQEDTHDERYGTITSAMKMKVAQPDPWWKMLDDSQRATILERYPFYALVIGKESHGLFKVVHDRNLKEFETMAPVCDTPQPPQLHESPIVIDEHPEDETTDNNDYVNYDDEEAQKFLRAE